MAAHKGNQYAKGHGRPSKFKEAYCDLVIEAGTEGKSLTSFAAEIGVCRDTISQWMVDHESFSVAVKKAKAKCAAWWEDRGREIALKGGGPGSATLVVFGLKNMAPDDWIDLSKSEITGKDGQPIQTQSIAATEDDLIEQAKRLGIDPSALGIGAAKKTSG